MEDAEWQDVTRKSTKQKKKQEVAAPQRPFKANGANSNAKNGQPVKDRRMNGNRGGPKPNMQGRGFAKPQQAKQDEKQEDAQPAGKSWASIVGNKENNAPPEPAPKPKVEPKEEQPKKIEHVEEVKESKEPEVVPFESKEKQPLKKNFSSMETVEKELFASQDSAASTEKPQESVEEPAAPPVEVAPEPVVKPGVMMPKGKTEDNIKGVGRVLFGKDVLSEHDAQPTLNLQSLAANISMELAPVGTLQQLEGVKHELSRALDDNNKLAQTQSVLEQQLREATDRVSKESAKVNGLEASLAEQKDQALKLREEIEVLRQKKQQSQSQQSSRYYDRPPQSQGPDKMQHSRGSDEGHNDPGPPMESHPHSGGYNMPPQQQPPPGINMYPGMGYYPNYYQPYGPPQGYSHNPSPRSNMYNSYENPPPQMMNQGQQAPLTPPEGYDQNFDRHSPVMRGGPGSTSSGNQGQRGRDMMNAPPNMDKVQMQPPPGYNNQNNQGQFGYPNYMFHPQQQQQPVNYNPQQQQPPQHNQRSSHQGWGR